MGSDRKWIYLSYIVTTLLLAWILNQALLLVVNYVRIDNPTILGVMPASALLSVVVVGTAGFLFFRQEHVNVFSMEVAQEVRKVTWPDRKTVYMSTVVVVISVIIAAVVVGIFDVFCAWLVRLVIGAQ